MLNETYLLLSLTSGKGSSKLLLLGLLLNLRTLFDKNNENTYKMRSYINLNSINNRGLC